MRTAFEEHGALSVKGTQLVDAAGKPLQLKGPSTLGIIWYPQYINKAAFRTIRDWGGNLIRLAMYTMEEDGYLSGGDQEQAAQVITDQAKLVLQGDRSDWIRKTNEVLASAGINWEV